MNVVFSVKVNRILYHLIKIFQHALNAAKFVIL
jgi:hypothetical protein